MWVLFCVFTIFGITPPLKATSLQQPFFLADSPHIHSCFNLSTTAIFFGGQSTHSLLFQPLYNSHFFWRTVHTFTLVSTSLQQPFFLADSPHIHSCFNLSTTAIFFGGQSTHSLLFQPLYNSHLFWRTVHTFTLVSTSLQQPSFLADSPHIHSCFNLSTMSLFFCPQGGCCREVQLYIKLLVIANVHNTKKLPLSF